MLGVWFAEAKDGMVPLALMTSPPPDRRIACAKEYLFLKTW